MADSVVDFEIDFETTFGIDFGKGDFEATLRSPHVLARATFGSILARPHFGVLARFVVGAPVERTTQGPASESRNHPPKNPAKSGGNFGEVWFFDFCGVKSTFQVPPKKTRRS